MLNFDYQNQTRLIYGEGEYHRIGELLAPYKTRILLHYGGGSIKRRGLYDAIIASLTAAGVDYCELAGVRANPELELVRKGIALAQSQQVGLILAVGGGSVIDSAKAIAIGASNKEDIWDIFAQKLPLTSDPLPTACILTLPAAGSENSINTVISNDALSRKLGYGDNRLRPALSIISPELFLSLPPEQMAYGACDMLCHVMERYFSNTPNTELSDALSEASMRTIMQQALILRRHPQSVEAWGQLALSGTIAHNNILGIGREQSWACHGLEHELSAVYNSVAHGAGLAVIVPTYIEAVWQASPGIFAQWAVNVMGVTASRDEQSCIEAGIAALRNWYRQIGLPQSMEDLAIPENCNWRAMAEAAIRVRGGALAGVKPLDGDDALAIYHGSRRAKAGAFLD